MTKFGDMPVAERNELVSKLGDLLKEHGLPVEVKVVQEVVYNMQETTGEHNVNCLVRGEMPNSLKDKVDQFNAAVKPLIEGKEGVSVSLSCTVSAGMPYQTIEDITNCENDDKVKLEHDGQAWLVDFWATWCPPCQAPMAHNQKMLEENEEAWKGKVRIIGISIDQARDTVAKHVESKGWGKVDHFFRSTSNCSDVYGVRGVPHVMLVDNKGTIVYKGHPASRPDLKDDLTKLGNGEELTGEGIKALVAAGDGDAAPEIKVGDGFTQMDTDGLDAEITNFKAACTGWQQDSAVQEAAKGMLRSFCVIVLQSSYNPFTAVTTAKYENFRVLVGAQEKIDTLAAKFKTLEGYTFKVNEQVQAK